MPQRLLRPGLKDSERWNAVDWITQSFYIRLLNLVDDYGRYYGNPLLLKGHCFALREDVDLQTVANSCQQLSDKRLAVFYEINGCKFLQLTNWQERVRTKSKFPDPPAGICEQMTAVCLHLIGSPSSPPSSPPSPPLVLEPETIKERKVDNDSQWLELLQKSEAYRALDVKIEYSKAECWCQVRKKKLSRSRFLAWLNKIDKPMSVTSNNGNGNHTPTGAEIILYNDEYKRVLDAMRVIRTQYQDHQTWTQSDLDKYGKLKSRKTELKTLLGIVA